MVDLEGVNSLEWQLHGEAWLKVSDGFRWTIRCFTLGFLSTLAIVAYCLFFFLVELEYFCPVSLLLLV